MNMVSLSFVLQLKKFVFLRILPLVKSRLFIPLLASKLAFSAYLPNRVLLNVGRKVLSLPFDEVTKLHKLLILPIFLLKLVLAEVRFRRHLFKNQQTTQIKKFQRDKLTKKDSKR